MYGAFIRSLTRVWGACFQKEAITRNVSTVFLAIAFSFFSVILSGENAIGADKSEGTRAVKMIKRYFYVVTNKNLDYARCRKEKIVARDREIFTNENVTNGERL